MKLTPLGLPILIKFLRPPELQPGAIYIPNLDLGPPKAVVLAQGSGINARGKQIGFETKVGDTVYVSNQITGTEIKEDGEVYGVITEDSLLGCAE